LVEKGANVVAQDNAGETALHWACSKGSVGCVDVLVEGGSNLSIRDSDGELASDVAKRKGYMKIFRYLKSHEQNRGRARTKADKVRSPFEFNILNPFRTNSNICGFLSVSLDLQHLYLFSRTLLTFYLEWRC
jgi:ankyrin repeat protein